MEKSPKFNSKNAKPLEELHAPFTEEKNFKVVCIVCGKRHFPDEDTFLTFYGNVTLGLQGGIIGNNFDAEGRLGRLTFICNNQDCFDSIFLGR